MGKLVPWTLAVFVVALSPVVGAPGTEVQPAKRPGCKSGQKVVEETVYKEVCKKVCRVVPDVKKETRNVYECRCEDFCLKRCPCCLCKGGSCDGCAGVRCGHPRTKHVLMKKIVTEERPTTKCVVEE